MRSVRLFAWRRATEPAAPEHSRLESGDPAAAEPPGAASRATPRWRRIALAALLIAPIAGAALLVAVHPPTKYRYRATASVLGGEGTSGLELLARLSGSVKLSEVLAATGSASAAPVTEDRVTVRLDEAARILRVDVRDRTPEAALQSADLLLGQAISFVEVGNAIRQGIVAPLADFEDESDGALTSSIFSVPPLAAPRTRQVSRFGKTSLHVTCPPRTACGPALQVSFPFRKGSSYVARVWARSDSSRTPVSLIMGSSSQNLANGSSRALTRTWRPYEVTWEPRSTVSGAEITLQIGRPVATTFDIDSVSLRAGAVRRVSVAQEGGTFTAARGRLLGLPAQPAGTIGTSALPWALAGAGLGLVAALAGIAAGVAASRRRRSE